MNRTFFFYSLIYLPQLCCVSTNIQRILDDNRPLIEQHLKKLQQKINSYEKNMQNKLTEYISRDIRPPVLIIPCPTNRYSPEAFTKTRSFDIVIDNKNSSDSLIQMNTVNSEDSLSIADNQ